MKIAVNTRLLLPGKLEGIGWFTHETLQRITTQHKEHHFIFLFDRKFSDEFIYADNITPVVKGPPARRPMLWRWWFEGTVPRMLAQHGPDLFLSPDGYNSMKAACKTLPVMHDLNFMHYPGNMRKSYLKYYRKWFPRFAKKADRIATVSEFSKKDIASQFGVAPEKIDVVYDGANENLAPASVEQIAAIRQMYANGKPYFLFVGAMHPRKNIANLLKAFDAFRESSAADTRLLIVGERMWWNKEMEKAHGMMKHAHAVHWTGRMGMPELQKIIPSALAMVYPSIFEGFGIPVLEAMYCNVPVITSNVTSMPEVAGEAALLVDPFSVESIKEAMLKMATDEPLRKTLIDKGKKQREKFTWQKTADLLWQSIEKTVYS